MPLQIIVTLDTASMNDVQEYVDGLVKKLEKPDPSLAVREVANVWRKRYDAQGGGTWPPLAPATIQNRIALGFGAGPMMKRTESLYRGIHTLFQQARSGNHSTRDNRGIATTASLAISGDTATLTVGGVKAVVHQKGNWNHPARPFWFTDPTTIEAAKIGVVHWIEREVLKT